MKWLGLPLWNAPRVQTENLFVELPPHNPLFLSNICTKRPLKNMVSSAALLPRWTVTAMNMQNLMRMIAGTKSQFPS